MFKIRAMFGAPSLRSVRLHFQVSTTIVIKACVILIQRITHQMTSEATRSLSIKCVS